jgi:molecular chaperone GrpE
MDTREPVKIPVQTDDDTLPDTSAAWNSAEETEGTRDRDAGPDPDPQPQTEEGEETAEAAPDLEQLLAEAKEENRVLYDRLLRLTAEFDNYKKRSDREMTEFRKFAAERLLRDLLPVADNLERALSTAEGNGSKGLTEGVELTLRALHKVLERYGVSPVEAVGKPFDPSFHEAMMQQPSSDHPEGSVMGEVQKGYVLSGRLIRPALVIVSSGAPAAPEQ